MEAAPETHVNECALCLDVLNLFTGFYFKIELKHDPRPPYRICECLLWLLGAEATEL